MRDLLVYELTERTALLDVMHKQACRAMREGADRICYQHRQRIIRLTERIREIRKQLSTL